MRGRGGAERNIIDVARLMSADRKRLLMPALTIERVRKELDTRFPAATVAVKVLEDLAILTEMTGQKKNRSYSYQTHVELPSR